MTTRRPQPPNLRRTFIQAVQQVNASVEDADKAVVLGQIAALLAEDKRIGNHIAFKGGAILRLVDDSPRFSKDLDTVHLTCAPIRSQFVHDVLTSPAAQKVILGFQPMYQSGDSLVVPIIECRPLSGRAKIAVTLSFNWSEPLQMTPEWQRITLPQGQTASLPVMARPERAAEKVRAFLSPERAAPENDAFDLAHYAQHVLTKAGWVALPKLITAKLAHSQFAVVPGTDLHALFEQRIGEVALVWGKRGRYSGLAPLPTWEDAVPYIRRFKTATPTHRI